MKIEGRYTNYDRYATNRPVHTSEIKDDTLKISQAGQLDLSDSVQKIRQEASTTHADNAKKIAELKAAIKDGSYQVSAKEIAASMVQAMHN